MKQLFFDVETSGTDYQKNGLLQLAGIFTHNGSEVDRFNYFMKPFEHQVVEDSALQANGITKDAIKKFKYPAEQYKEVIKRLDSYVDRFNKQDKIHLIGYNSRFDDSFLRKWFENNNNKFYGAYFWWPSIDVSNMVAVKYRTHRHHFTNFQLMTVAEKLKIDVNPDKAHDAMYDTEITKLIFEKVIAQ
jgi:DNA polymerase-3 subunit epsilon